jgi:c-di-GMP-binding flagellar brake protein YcgR
MEKLDRRKFPRVKIFNPICYDCVDKDGILFDKNMGIALDISQNGILLETAKRIESKNIFLLFVDLEDELIKIIGRVIFSVKKKDGKFKTGINFNSSDEENIQFAKKIIQAYHYHKSDIVLETTARV